MKNPRILQIGIILGITIIVGFLYAKDIKGLVAPKDEKTAVAEEPKSSGIELNLKELSTTAKNLISNASAKEITNLESKYLSANGDDKISQAKILAQKWSDLEQAAPSALYLEEVAKAETSLKNWVSAGEMFVKAYDNTQDSLVQPALLEKASHAFKEAIAIDSTSIDAKIGLGTTMVNGLGAPMQGITMLLDVVKMEPKNRKANMVLGVFAMKSGQFDKAVSRFETVINSSKATPDVYFYIATAYENLGKKEQAISAYLQSKKLAANPTLSNFIDKKVAELEK